MKFPGPSCTTCLHSPTLLSTIRMFPLSALLAGLLTVPCGAQAQDLVIAGTQGVWIRQGAVIESGDIAANASTTGGFLHKGVEVSIEEQVELRDPTSRVFGQRVHVQPRAQVFGVHAQSVHGKGAPAGTHVALVTPNPIAAFPPVPDVTAGTQPIRVPRHGARTLAAGRYGALTVEDGGILTLTGGAYSFHSWNIQEQVQVAVEAPSTIHIAERLDVDDASVVGPAPGADLHAADIVIVVTGRNGTTGALGAAPIAAEFGTHGTVTANVYAPHGTLRLREHSVITGAFLGQWVRVEEWTTVALDSAFALGSPAP